MDIEKDIIEKKENELEEVKHLCNLIVLGTEERNPMVVRKNLNKLCKFIIENNLNLLQTNSKSLIVS